MSDPATDTPKPDVVTGPKAKSKPKSSGWRYEPEPTIKEFHQGGGLFRGLMGPIGSGKSSGCCWELFRLACDQAPHEGVRRSRWGVIRSTYPELVSTTIRTFEDWFGTHCKLRKHDSPITGIMRMDLPDGTKLEMELFFVAVEREDDTRKLLSMELTGVWFNEARELPWGVVRDALGRIGRYPSPSKGGHTRKAAIADTNPPDDGHWWYALSEEGRLNSDAEEVTTKDFQFFKQPPALIMTEQGYAPNPKAENVVNLTDGFKYYMDLVPGRDPEWIKVYVMGEYGTIADGKPVYGKTFSDSQHTSKVAFTPVKRWPVVVSFDFGRTPAVLFAQQTPRGQLRIIEEIVTEDSDIRTVCRNLVRPRLQNQYRDCPVYVTGDPAGNTRGDLESETCYDVIRQELAGLVTDIVPAETNDPTQRVDSVKKLLMRLTEGVPVFQISPECRTLRKGFLGGYKYRLIRLPGGQHRVSESPDKNIYSHIHDACQYACLYVLGSLKDSLSVNVRGTGRGYVTADRVAGL